MIHDILLGIDGSERSKHIVVAGSGNIAGWLRPWLRSQGGKTRKRTGIGVAPSFIMTATAAAIMDALEFTQHIPDIIVVTGGPGVGTTLACTTSPENNSNVWLLTAEPSARTARQLLAELADIIGLYGGGRAESARVSATIIKRLTATAGLLVVDEAQNLPTEATEQLRAIFDRSNIGVALIGKATIRNRLENRDRSENYAQLLSRVGMRVNRPRPPMKDVSVWLDSWQLKGDEMRRSTEEIARESGAFRGLTTARRIAKMMADVVGLPEPTGGCRNKGWENLSSGTS
jgi:DNA transposition AAA+ family ATPase